MQQGKKVWIDVNPEGKDIKDVYKFSKKLGSGQHATVYLATNKTTGDKYAAKAIKRDSVENDASFETEAKIAMKLDHPNIVKVYETWQTSTHYFLVMELCEGGELLHYVSD